MWGTTGRGARQTWVTEGVEKPELRTRRERDSRERTDGEKTTLCKMGEGWHEAGSESQTVPDCPAGKSGTSIS